MKVRAPAKPSPTTTASHQNGATLSGPFFRARQDQNDAFFVPAEHRIQTALEVSQPGDPHEVEAERVADQVVHDQDHSTPTAPAIDAQAKEDLHPAEDTEETADQETEEKTSDSATLHRASLAVGSAAHSPRATTRQSSPNPLRALHRQPVPPALALVGSGISTSRAARIHPFSARGPPEPDAKFTSHLRSSKGGGSQLPDSTRLSMENSFQADFGSVRVHTDQRAQEMSRSIQAKAFTHGQDIYFSPSAYQPETSEGRHLLAHELTHVVQQGHGVRPRSNLIRAPPSIQRIPTSMAEVREEINNIADSIPGYTLGTVLIGYNPILGRNVEWSASAFFRAAAGLLPGGTKIYDKLNEGGALDAAFKWIEGRINNYNLTWSRVKGLWDTAWSRMGITEGISGNVRIFKNTFSGFFGDVLSFVQDCIAKLTEILKDLAVSALRALFGENGPAYDMITMVLGKDPVTDEPREWNTVDFLRSGLTLFGFENHLAKMEETGKLEEAAAWLDSQYALLSSAFSGLISGVKDIWDSFTLATLAQPLDLLQRIVGVVVGFVSKLIQFVGNLAAMILELIKQALIALLRPHVNSIPGYRLFTVVLGSDPVTGEQIPRTADNFVKGFLDYVPKGIETYNNLKEGNAIGKAMSWLSEQVQELGLSPSAIAARFVELWTSFTIDDLMNPLPAFQRVGETFLGFIGDVLTLVGRVGLKLLEILFEVVMGAAGGDVLAMLKKSRATFLTIVKDPVGFVGNLVRAGKLGFEMFAGNILEHLKKGVFGWLFGALEGAGLQLPATFDFKGILSLGLQILGLTYRQIRPKLVKHLGEKAVSYIETAAEVVKILVTEGLPGVWKRLKEFITISIPEMVIGAIKGFVIEKIVKSAVVKIASMLNPAGAVIQAIMAIYNTIMFFMERMSQIMQVVNSFVNSIAKIALGQIGEAAAFVEKTMGNLVPVLISFLARLLGLGGISEKIKGIIKKIQAPISKAIDKLIGWIVKMGRKLLKKAAQAGTGNMTPQQKLEKGMKLAVKAVNKFRGKKVGEAVLKPLLTGIKTRYDFQILKVVPDGAKWAVYGKVNPTAQDPTQAETGAGSQEAATDSEEKVLAAFKAAHPSGRILMRKVNLTVEGVAAGQVKTHLANLVKKNLLFYYESGGNDPYKMITADASKKGKRKIPSAGRRHLFGYNNPGHDTPTGRAVLAAWIDWDFIPQTPANTPASERVRWSFLSGARFRSWKTSKRNIREPETVLGHKTPANEHWNHGDGMQNTRSENLKWGNQVGTYGGVEWSTESSGEGGETYADPKPPKAAECWWNPTHPEYPKVGGYDWDYTGAMSQLKNGASSEAHELEANQMADFVTSGTRPQPIISRKSMGTSASARHNPARGLPRSHSLPNSTRQPMERSFGQDFGKVRIHHDETSANLADRINARAFTQGNNIYFNRGEYAPDTRRGQRLLAHELTHVVQQSSGRASKSIQRVPDESQTEQNNPQTPLVSRDTFEGPQGRLSRVGGLRMDLPTLQVPDFKGPPITPSSHLVIRRGRPEGEARATQQRQLWDATARGGSGLRTKLREKLDQAHPFGSPSNPIYYLRIGNSRGDASSFLIGTETHIRNRLLRPYWLPSGRTMLFEVDHKREYQLNGPDTLANLWLLERKANGSSGRNIDGDIERNVNALLNASRGSEFWRGQDPPGFREAKRSFNEIRFNSVEATLPYQKERGGPHTYTMTQIKEEATQLDSIQPLSLNSVRRLGLVGSPTRLVIFNNRTGGRRHHLNLPNAEVSEVPFTDESFLPGFKPTTAVLTPNGPTLARLRGRLWSDNPILNNQRPVEEIEINRFEGLEHTGVLNVTSLRTKIQTVLNGGGVSLRGMSPIQMTSFDLVGAGGMNVRGKVLPDIPLIAQADIDLAILGNDVRLEKTFNIEDIRSPSPLHVTHCSITAAIGTESGLSISGEAGLEIPGVARGGIGAEASAGVRRGDAGFRLNGNLEFDTDLFSRASVDMSYQANGAQETFSISGVLGIDEGKVPGIHSAEATVTYNNGALSAQGNAQLAIPGVDSVALNLSLPEAGGFTIGGTSNLSSDIPGIENGSVGVTITKPSDVEAYQVSASGTAVPSVPGVNTRLNVAYQNGAITIGGRAEYERGILNGSIELGATNRPIGDDGQPTDGEPTESFSFFGAGSITVQITPWLDGTVGVRFFPNAELEVSGQIALANSYEVFSRLEVPERELIGLGFDIPIFAIPVGPRSIGLKATIAGGLRAYAGIGPGQLRELSLGMTYNPDHVDQTRIQGTGRFVIPADAGLRLAVQASIGLDALVGGVEGGLEIAGGLGLEAEAGADVDVDWTPSSGLALDASLFASIQPQLLFSVDGFIRAWILFYDKEWRWSLTNYRYGPDLRFAIRMPIAYREGQPFNPSFDDIQLTYPQINAQSFLRGLIRDIRGQRN